MSDWRPIETAPRDGTFVILCDVRIGGVREGWWDADREWFRTSDTPDWETSYIDPTHWMPLPELPEAHTEGARNE